MALDGNILDSFWVSLGFRTDPKGIEQFEQASEKLRGFVLKLGAALSVPALGLFVEEVAKSVGHLKHFADVNHLSFEELQAFNAIARENSIDVESMDQGIANFNKRLGQAQIGTGRLLPILKKLGIGLKDARGHTKDVNAVMADLADKMHKFAAAGEGEKNLGLGQRLGLDPGMVLLLEKGSKAWREMFAEARKGAGLTAEEGDLARKTDDLFQQARHNIEILWDRIAFRLMPTVIRLLDKFNDWVKTLSPDKVNAFNRALDTMEKVAASIGEDLTSLTKTLLPFIEWIADETPVEIMKDALYLLALALTAVGAGLVLATGKSAALGIIGLGSSIVSMCKTAIPLLSALAASEWLAFWPLALITAALAGLGFAGYELYKHSFDDENARSAERDLKRINPAYRARAAGWSPAQLAPSWGSSHSSKETTVIHHHHIEAPITVVSPDPTKAGEAVKGALKSMSNRTLIRNAQSGTAL